MSNADRYLARFSERLKQAREAAQLSQEVLAERVEVSRVTVVRWEGEALKPSFDHLVAVAEATGQELSWFFAEDESPAREMPDIPTPKTWADVVERLSQIQLCLERLD